MAARKKAKAKVKRKKTPARRPATLKKTAQVRKKAAGKKPTVRHVAPKKKPAARPSPKARPARTPPRPTGAEASAPLAGEERVGTVTHYYSHLSVAVVQMEAGSLRVGDTIHVWGHTSDFRQRVESMQIEHQPVFEVSAGQEFGLGVTDHARERDVVYKVTAPLR
ncbi:MAG TPA: hypothetical protein VLL03_02105 [Burkholderiales bacterium]|nr:hypothetical protein [Burkholderiales bacterium]